MTKFSNLQREVLASLPRAYGPEWLKVDLWSGSRKRTLETLENRGLVTLWHDGVYLHARRTQTGDSVVWRDASSAP